MPIFASYGAQRSRPQSVPCASVSQRVPRSEAVRPEAEDISEGGVWVGH